MKRKSVRGAILLSILFFVGVAIGQTDSTQTSLPMCDVFLLLDNSGSMDDAAPIELFKPFVSEFISILEKTSRVGVISFSSSAEVLLPLTEIDNAPDSKIQSALSKIDWSGQYTNLPEALEKSLDSLGENRREGSQRLIIMLTDGIIDTGNKKNDDEKRTWVNENLTTQFRDSGIKIFNITLSEKADFDLVQTLGRKTNGGSYQVLEKDDVSNVISKIKKQVVGPGKPIVKKTDQEEAASSAPAKQLPEDVQPGAKAETATEQAPDSVTSKELEEAPASKTLVSETESQTLPTTQEEKPAATEPAFPENLRETTVTAAPDVETKTSVSNQSAPTTELSSSSVPPAEQAESEAVDTPVSPENLPAPITASTAIEQPAKTEQVQSATPTMPVAAVSAPDRTDTSVPKIVSEQKPGTQESQITKGLPAKLSIIEQIKSMAYPWYIVVIFAMVFLLVLITIIMLLLRVFRSKASKSKVNEDIVNKRL